MKLPAYQPLDCPEVESDEVLISLKLPDWLNADIEAEYDTYFDCMDTEDKLYVELDEFMMPTPIKDDALNSTFRTSCIAHTLQLVIKDGLNCLEVGVNYLS